MMPPKKKKNPVNAFAIFMEDVKKERERKGERFPGGLRDVAVVADPLWKALSAEDKNYYNDLAAKRKGEDKRDLAHKYTSLGVSYQDLENERLRKEEELNIMLTTIHSTVSNLDFNTTFKTKSFHMCHVNFYYKNDNDVYKPAEIAFSEFNLKYGVIKTLHRFVDSGSIETGFRLAAKTQIEKTHNIPISDHRWKCGERDYVKLLQDIKSFLLRSSTDGRLPPIYTMPDNTNNNTSINAVKSTLNTLCEAASEDPIQFKIYELHHLYHELRLKATKESDYKTDIDTSLYSAAMAYSDLEKDMFSYSKHIACDYHEEKDLAMFCSLSVVIRWAYTICDFILQFLPDNILPGGHVPKDSETSRLNSRAFHQKITKPEISKSEVKQVATRDSEPSFTNGMQPFNIKSPTKVSSAVSYSAAALDAPGPSTRAPRASPQPTAHLIEPLSTAAHPIEHSLSQPANTHSQEYVQPRTTSLSQGNQINDNNYWPFLGRGRGVQARPSTEINWSLVAGRGAFLRNKPS